tara:strand:+ start:1848 stop:2282 length:435 start_codon:yes stop_codon:yes gene_type:complete
MDVLSSFSVYPKKTFFGLDKSSGHCFTLRKAITPSFINSFNLKPGNLQTGISLVTEEGEFPAILRLVIQDKSRPNKTGIERRWKYREVLSMSWKNKEGTVTLMRNNLDLGYRLIERGLKNNRQCVNFEHLGGNRFYLTFGLVFL